MSVTRLIVGDGRVARALATSLPSALRWSRRAGGMIFPADEIVLAVSDRAIGEVARQVMAAQPADSRPVLLHCAGARSAEEALGDARVGCRGVALLHPLRAVTGSEPSLGGTVFGIEGDAVGVEVARAWVAAMGGVPLFLTAAQLPRYHAAAVLVANHALALVDAGAALLTEAGLPADTAVQALGQLLRSSADNVVEHGLPRALTGPIARGDVAVVARHLAELSDSLEAALYRATARRVLALARALGQAPAEALDEIAGLL